MEKQKNNVKIITNEFIDSKKRGDNMELSELIKNQMIDRTLTVRELSEFLGISKEAIHKWRDGSRNPKGKNRIKLFKLLNIKESEIG